MTRQAKASLVQSIGVAGVKAARSSFASLLALTGFALCAALALFASPALADVTHPYTGTSFGPGGTTSGSTFESVQGVAVDQASGDVFVLDGVAGKIYKFDEDGEPVDFSSLGTNVIEGVGSGGSDESPVAEKEIAVAPAGSPGGTAGDIYIANARSTFKVYAPSGQELPEVETGGSETCGVATDPAGHVYAGVYSSTILEYTPSANPPVTTDKTAENTEVNVGLCNVAADATGNVYAANFGQGLFKLEGLGDTTPTEIDPAANSVGIDPSNGDVYADRRDEVAQYSASGTLLGSFGAGQLTHSRGVAVNVTVERVYAGSGTTVKVFGAPAFTPSVQTGEATNVTSLGARLNGTVDPEGIAPEECEFEYRQAKNGEPFSSVPCAESVESIGHGNTPVAVHADISGLVGSTEYSFRIVAKNENGISKGLERGFKTIGPAVTGLSISAISDHGATFAAEVNPNSQETSYVFEYVSEEEFQGNGFANAKSVPAGGEDVGAGSDAIPVTQTVSDLSPETTYRVRIAATNEGGVSTSADQSFLTYGPYAPGLPDGRAYEQATPTEKNGSDISGVQNILRTSANGDAVSYFVNGGGGGKGGGGQAFPSYAAMREGDWTTHTFLPSSTFGERVVVLGWSEDLRRDYVLVGNSGTPGTLYEQDVTTGTMREIVGGIPIGFGTSAYADESADGGKVLFESKSALVPNAIEGSSNLYLWDREAAAVSLVNRLPDESVPADGAFAGPYVWPGEVPVPTSGGSNAGFYTRDLHVMSDDGSKVFFTTSGDNQLYVREGLGGVNPETIRVSASQKTNGSGPGGTDPNGPGRAAFMEATPDGRYVFFTSSEELTNDANTGTADQGKDLYRFDTNSGQLVDLTPDSIDENGARVRGVIGSSTDGSYAYFAANGDLAEGATNEVNVYRWHEGQVAFVTSFPTGAFSQGQGGRNWLPTSFLSEGGVQAMKTGRVSQDGKTLVFMSWSSPTTYDSEGAAEFYRYNVDEGLECISCNPTGVPPIGGAEAQDIKPGISLQLESSTLARNVSADGERVFFETPDKLVGGDTNGDHGCPTIEKFTSNRTCQDVYEWEANGSGSCESEAQHGGCLYLISTGESDEPSYFAGASTSGDDAFFFTRQQLVRQDTDQLRDIYDARIGGGISSQNKSPPTPCEGEACKPGAISPPVGSAAGSATFSGPGNTKPNRHKKKTKKHHKKHTKKKHHGEARASADQRGQR